MFSLTSLFNSSRLCSRRLLKLKVEIIYFNQTRKVLLNVEKNLTVDLSVSMLVKQFNFILYIRIHVNA